MINKPFVFVLMPFTSDFDDIYKLGIKSTAEELGTYCERVDEQIFQERILDRIYNQINKADIIIADLTGKNANVFYETGFAHALNKKVILLTQFLDDIPFDLRHHPHIIYEGKITKLKSELSKRLSYFVSNPELKQIPNSPLEFYIEGQQISEGSIITIEKDDLYMMASRGASIKIDICNHSSVCYNLKFCLGVVANPELITLGFDQGNQILLSNGNILAISEDLNNIYPNSWKSTQLTLNKPGYSYLGPVWETNAELELKIFNEFSTESICFKFNIIEKRRKFSEL